MRSGIVGLGMKLSMAILATSASAADHTDPATFGAAGAAAVAQSATPEDAVRRFVDAFVNRDTAGLAQATTGDFEVEYGLAQAGTYLGADEDALTASWQKLDANPSARAEHPVVKIFPTSDANTVFVTYRIPGDAIDDRIAVVELRGKRVSRVRDLVAPLPEFVHPDPLGGGLPAGSEFAASHPADAQVQAARILTGDPVRSTSASVATREAGLQRPASEGESGDAQSRARQVLVNAMGE